MHRINLVVALLAAALLLAAPSALAATSNVVVSQVYASGGNAGATYLNDFVELFNRGTAAIDLAGWSVQYASSTSTSWAATPLAGSIQPGRHYLVQLASTAAVGAPLPAPEATGTSNLAAAGGKVALVRDASPLACGAAPGSCSGAALLEDLVGYGTASDYEGAAAAPALTGTTAAVRQGGGCTDTDANAADFAAAAPAPRNGSTAASGCSGTPASGTAATAAVDVELASFLSLALERPSLSFGQVFAGQTPPSISEHVTVVSNDTAGYVVTVHRGAFAPADLPLGIAPSAAGALAPIPVAPAADLVLATTGAATPASGDVVPATVGFTSALPILAPGRYTSTLTFTVIGR
jgi:hypothetical protein